MLALPSLVYVRTGVHDGRGTCPEWTCVLVVKLQLTPAR
jgi:hypothetical protein